MAWNRYSNYGGFRPYVSVATRRANAAKHAQKLAKGGTTLSPVTIAGTKIATSFWGKAWCTHLESYSDFANRLPRGRSYVRNGSVIDLQITPGKITAQVMGSSLYKETITIAPLEAKRWAAIKAECAGKIDSLVGLLQGRLSDAVMRIITDRERGLFPAPSEIKLGCSCPDWADMCKHVAAVLYGVGARLDAHPELLFVLRGVDYLELISAAAQAPRAGGGRRCGRRRDGRGGVGRRVWHRDRKRGSRGPAGRDAVGGETCPSGWEENRQPNARGKTGSAARKVRRKSKADAAVETAGKDGRVCGKNGRDRSQAGAAKKTPVTRAENDVNGAAR